MASIKKFIGLYIIKIKESSVTDKNMKEKK